MPNHSLLKALCYSSLLSGPCLAADCRSEAESAVGLVRRNYSGFEEKSAQLAQKLEESIAQLRSKADAAKSDDDCLIALNDWLSIFRDRHLTIDPKPQQATATPTKSQRANESPATSLTFLTTKTAVLRIPTFALEHAPNAEKILRRNQRKLLALDQLVIDLRGNGGGSDRLWRRLLPIISREKPNLAPSVYLATPEILQAWDWIATPPPPNEKKVPTELAELIARLRTALLKDGDRPPPAGRQWVTIESKRLPTRSSASSSPRQVLLVVDSDCASACEDFVLAARQLSNFRIMGSTTAGIHDYGDVLPYSLPSTKTVLLIPSMRNGDINIDNVGVKPDQDIPAATLEQWDASGLVAWAKEADLTGLWKTQPPQRSTYRYYSPLNK